MSKPDMTDSRKDLNRTGFAHIAFIFHKDENGQKIWKDSFVYAILAEDLMSEGHG